MGISSCVKACWDVKRWCYDMMVDSSSRSSRLAVVRHTSCPAHTTEDVQEYADTLDSWSWPISLFLMIIANGFVSNHVLPRHRSSPPAERFVCSCFHASSDDDNRSPFQLSLVHAIFLTCFLLLRIIARDTDRKSSPWRNVLRWWRAQM